MDEDPTIRIEMPRSYWQLIVKRLQREELTDEEEFLAIAAEELIEQAATEQG